MKKFVPFFFTVLFLLVAIALPGEKTILTGEKPPVPSVKISSASLTVKQGSYCWNGGCVDVELPSVEGDKPIQKMISKPEQKLYIDFNDKFKPTTLYITRIKNGRIVKEEIKDNELELPSEEGLYFFDLYAKWNDKEKTIATSHYNFYIDIR